MARSKHGVRRKPRPNPQGPVSVAHGGYGFVETPEGEFFIPASKMNGAMHGDVVEVARAHINYGAGQSRKEGKQVGSRATARVVRVVSRANHYLVGRFEILEPFGVVIPDDPRITHDVFTRLGEGIPAREGQTVRVRIETFPSRYESAFGTVVEVLDESTDGIHDIQRVILAHNLATEFSSEALFEAKQAEVDVQGALDEGYLDLRDRVVITIDPHDARDFDDALSIEKWKDGWTLGVHIADVSHYVRQGTALDKDARHRSTSVYLVDRVIPMLPEELSCGVCSLQEGQDRRAFTVDLWIDGAGALRTCQMNLSLIRSDARLTYDQVQTVLDKLHGHPLKPEVPAFAFDMIRELDDLAKVLRTRRAAQGSLSLTSREPHVILDGQGRPTHVEIRRTTDATSLVEQAMIMANAAVAGYLHRRELPCMYRIHEAPASAGLQEAWTLLATLGCIEGVDRESFIAGEPQALQQALDAAQGEGAQELASLLVLRSLKRAEYSADCRPHFALALEEYCHFTSPIRRYPDLLVHRMLRQAISGEVPDMASAHMADMAEHCSAAERTADAAAMDSQGLKLAELMAGQTGQEFWGMVTKVTGYGIFVTLENTATGLACPSVDYGEPFSFDARRALLVGQDSGRVFRLGQRVLVRLDRVNVRECKLDFSLPQARGKAPDPMV